MLGRPALPTRPAGPPWRALLVALALVAGLLTTTATAATAAPGAAAAGTTADAAATSADAAGPARPTAICTPTSTTGPAAPTPSGGFHALTPQRLLDSRTSIGPVAPGCTAVVDLVAAVPAEATGVALSIVGVDSSAPGYVTAHPCGAPRPLASNLNLRVGQAVPNTVVLPVDATRRACFYTDVSTQLVVDVTGWFGPGGASFHGTTPERALDTRTTTQRPDGGRGPLRAGTEIRLPVAGHGSVPNGATGVVVNLTVTETAGEGYLTAYPCGAARPFTSTGNYEAGDTRALQVMVGLGGGDLCVFSPTTVELVVDVAGWFAGTDGTRVVPLTGTRVVDSRDGTGGWSTPIGVGEVRAFDPSLGGTVPVGAAAVLDVVATGATGPGWVTLYPCGGAVPYTSSVNPFPGVTSTNVAVVPLGDGGLVCAYSTTSVDLVIDVDGSFGGAGGLRALSVTGAGPLTPSFTPDGHDYGVRCGIGFNRLTVTAAGVPGSTVAISGASPSGAVTLEEDELVTITVTRADASTDRYWVRCLPHDFPDLRVSRPDDPTPGWYLTTTGVQAPAGTSYALVLDDHGAPVWYRKTATPVIDLQLLPDGDVSWVPLLGPTFGVQPDGAYEQHALDGSLVRTWSTVGTPTDHHEMEALANGDKLMVSYHLRQGVDLTALGAGYGAAADVVEAWIQQVRPDGTVAWEWHSEDHIDPAETTAQRDGLAIDAPLGDLTVTDLLHVNSLDVDPATGDVIVSARHLDAVFAVRRHPGQPDDGTVRWKVGGDAPTSPATADLTVVGDALGGPHRQHDARLSASGHLTMFDNESATSSPARAVDYRLDLAAGTATLVWEHRRPDGLASFGLGSVRRQADGSTVICWGGLPPLLTDLGPSGAVTLEVSQAPSGITYRTIKEPTSALDPDVLRATAGR